ncbi:hypothetical protein [Amycolatopsis sp. RTGN1]|uniref:hypothetical protein n=1 Tax=Amycolatopsis ponsaeliensis TaxID=2992142 RepID=UPI0033072D15
MTIPMPVQEIVDAQVARLSGALRTRTAKPSRRRVLVVRSFPGRRQARGTAAATRTTAVARPSEPPRSPASPGPARAAAVNVSASSRLACGSFGPATAGS